MRLATEILLAGRSARWARSVELANEQLRSNVAIAERH
jgi:hypothetical protein